MAEVVQQWDCSDVYIGCSGNFTAERVIRAVRPNLKLHSNDVTLYSSALGSYLAEEPFVLALRDGCPDWCQFLEHEGYLGSQQRALASVMLLTNVMQCVNGEGQLVEGNPYYQRYFKAFMARWPEFHQTTVDRINEETFRLDSYTPQDVNTWIADVPRDQGFVVYPPFAGVGAAEQYQRETAKMERIFVWDKPPFDMFTDESRLRFLEGVVEFKHWILASNRIIEPLSGYHCATTQLTSRGTKVLVYANTELMRLVTPRGTFGEVPVPRLSIGDEIGDKMELRILDYRQFRTLRSEYMNIGIRPGAASLSIAVLVDDMLIGCFAFSFGGRTKRVCLVSQAYLLSDFSVRPTDYARLSRLILYAALSKESGMLAERICKHRIRSMQTTAYSNHYQSMKYRGLFKLKFRKPNPTQNAEWGENIDLDTNSYYSRPWQLEYVGEVGRWTLDEGLKEWKRRYGGIKNADNEDNFD